MDPCSNPKLMQLKDALSLLLNKLPIIAIVEPCAYQDSYQHFISDDCVAQNPVPTFANSAMDGYAFAYADVEQSNPSLTIATHILAGDTKQHKLESGECARIMTGAPMPQGADTVIMQENTHREDQQVFFTQVPKKGANVRHSGDSIAQGAIVVPAGTQINAAHIGLLASTGTQQVNCYKPLTVGLFSSGDELRQAGEPLSFGQIYDSNRDMLHALLTQLPVTIKDYGTLSDDLDEIEHALMKADQECDVVLSSAGVSVGSADFIKEALDKLGNIELWKVAMKPGKPFTYGQLPHSYFFGLPGNPVSAAVTFLKLVIPALTKLGGGHYQAPVNFLATATAPFRKKPGRLDFQRAVASINTQGQWEVYPVSSQSSASLMSFVEGNCFAVLEQHRGAVEVGEQVYIEFFPANLN